MKLNKREKILLSVMVVVLLTGGYYKFVFSPQRAKINSLIQQKEENNNKLQNVNKQLASKSKIETDIKVLNSKLLDMTSELFPEIKQENFIITIDKILQDAKLRGINLSFSDIKAVPVETANSEDKNDKTSSLKSIVDEYNGAPVKKQDNKKSDNNNSKENKDSKDNKDKPSAENISLNISFKGPFQNVMQFIKGIESYSKKIVVSNLQISQGGTDGVTGSMQLEFYAIPKVSNEDKEFFKWELNNAYGKDNPFDGAVQSAAVSSIIEDIAKNIKQPTYDFVMSLRPISSELPTVILGRGSDSSRNTYVYGDSPQTENVEIYFTKKDGKYYYKYKTSRNSYPAQYSGDGEEFTPAGNNINFKIYSLRRKDDADKSGANIKLYNNTDKTVSITIETDDSERPRTVISGQGGNIEIVRN